MKLLLDQNLSRRLIGVISTEFPDSVHVIDLGMEESDDIEIWDYAKDNDFTIVSKDRDFWQRSILMGHPPKVVRLRVGNCKVDHTAKVILDNADGIKAFLTHEAKSCLLLA